MGILELDSLKVETQKSAWFSDLCAAGHDPGSDSELSSHRGPERVTTIE